MKTIVRLAASTGLAVVVASCGGSNGQSGTVGVISATPTPTPTATPTPTPTATATPTPTPAPTPTPTAAAIDYSVNPCDYTRNQSYTLTGGVILATGPATGSAPFTAASSSVIASQSRAQVSFTASGSVATFLVDGTTVGSGDASTRETPVPNNVSYTTGNRGFGFGCEPIMGTVQRYAVTVLQTVNIDPSLASGNDAEARVFVGGLRTGDTTAVASRSYATTSFGIGYLVGTSTKRQSGAGTASTLTYSAAANTISGTVTIAASNGQPAVTLTLNGSRVVGSSLVTGTATSTGGTGLITGGFFGPAGDELALVATLDRGSDRFVIYVYGR